jgi:hypothetical protein
MDVYPLAAAAVAGYIVAERAQSTARTSQMQLVQSVLCVTAAVDSARCCTALIWLELFAAVIHLAIAMALYELHRISDCRRCMNEAYRCECGQQKDPLPPGALAHLVAQIESQWSSRIEREK